MIIIEQKLLDNLLRQASFQANGDTNEQIYGGLVVPKFPNCELFWKLFVVPYTERISGYPYKLENQIRARQGNDPEIEDIGNTNYTIFLNLVYAHIHLHADNPSSLEDFYVHLGSSCDLAETFLEKWVFLLIKCRGYKSDILQHLTREDFLKLAGEWYDKNYLTLYEHYFAKGKATPIRIPSRKNIVKELFDKYLKNTGLISRYFKYSQSIREFRNVIVHDVQVGRLFDQNGNIYIPRPQVILKYKTWRQVFSAGNNEEKRNDFRPMKQQMKSDIIELETILNEIWGLIIQEFILEFYSNDRKILRDMYCLSLENN
ncbi:MAG: hypothetical protein WCW53_07360 [Syntrophales bacterium]|jgi:hypothetical protein